MNTPQPISASYLACTQPGLSGRAQSGSALIISLVILTAITIGAVVTMERSSGQLRMIANMQTQQQVFQTALSPLRSIRTGINDDNEDNFTQWIDPMVIKARAEHQNGRDMETITADPTSDQSGKKLIKNIKLNSGTQLDENTLRISNIPAINGGQLKKNAGNSSTLANSRLEFYNTTTASAGRLDSQQVMTYYRIYESSLKDD